MSAFGKLKAILTGSGRSTPRPTQQADDVYEELRSAHVPVTDVDCRSCPDPCDQDHDDYTNRISVDMDTELLGSVKPYRRQVVISTGKSDWQKEVTEADGTLAAFLSSADEKFRTKPGTPDANDLPSQGTKTLPAGIFTQETAGRLSILNGNHNSLSLHHDTASTLETVLILPDYKFVTDVPRSLDGAKLLWTTALDPAYGGFGSPDRSDTLKSWILPYSCLILLCSHKRRDKRCAVAAPVLEKSFTQCLEHEGWEVHTDLEDLSSKPTLESLLSSRTPEGQDLEAVYQSQLRTLGGEHKALILRSSHIGGHKFAGNVVIYTPGGASVWYGRVTPHHVESIVKNTIIGGQVLPAILRGGLNLVRPGCRTLHDW
ncbi:Sucrase/ferredoxin-like-domain-containing protein [Scleroderma yunnanense]